MPDFFGLDSKLVVKVPLVETLLGIAYLAYRAKVTVTVSAQ